LNAKANRPNVFIKIPGTLEGLPAIEETIFSDVPVNVTLLFSRGNYVLAADAYVRGPGASRCGGIEPRRAFVARCSSEGDDGEGAGRPQGPARHQRLPAELRRVSRPVEGSA
jgi:transaldolase